MDINVPVVNSNNFDINVSVGISNDFVDDDIKMDNNNVDEKINKNVENTYLIFDINECTKKASKKLIVALGLASCRDSALQYICSFLMSKPLFLLDRCHSDGIFLKIHIFFKNP